jgi:hypothetical protein
MTIDYSIRRGPTTSTEILDNTTPVHKGKQPESKVGHWTSSDGD